MTTADLTGATGNAGADNRPSRSTHGREDRRPVWMERPSLLGNASKTLVIVLITALVVTPFWIVLATSFSSEADIIKHGGFTLWPSHPSLAAYRTIFSGGVVIQALAVSFGVTLFGTGFSVLATVGMAYALSKRHLVGGRFFLMTALLTMLFSPGIIPNFLLVKQLGLLDSYVSLVLPTLVSAFSLVILRQFFMSLPNELFDAAHIDGAGEFAVLRKIVLPLSKGVIAVVSLFYAVGYWNSFFNAMLYLNTTSKWPLSLVLRLYVIQGAPLSGDSTGAVAGEAIVPAQAIQMAVVVVSVVPILMVYPFLQRYFTKGVISGAIKG